MTDKPVLALVPGLLCDAALWRPQLEAFEGSYDCRVADITGHDSMAAIAGAVLAALPERFALAGLSMGGYVAFEMLRQAPQRIERLALLDTRASGDTPEDKARREALLALARDGGFDDVIERLLPLFLHEDRLGDAPLVDAVRAMAHRIGPAAFERQTLALLGRAETLSMLPDIACPTLILCGRQDALTPLAYHEVMAERISGAELVVIEDCGHLTTMERPEAVNAALAAWLTR